MIRVLVSHSATIAGESLAQALRDDGGFVVAVRSAARDAARVLRIDRPDVVIASVANLMDDDWPNSTSPARMPLLGLVDRRRGERAAHASAWGARAICSEVAGADEVVAAARHVAAGGGWVSRDLVPDLLDDYGPICRRRVEAQARIAHLDDRELRLLNLLGAGKRNDEIARELHLAISTVKEYVGRLLNGLGLTRLEAVALVYDSLGTGARRAAGLSVLAKQ